MAKAERLEAIDCLRGIASLGIVFLHLVGFIPYMEIPVGPIGAAAVYVSSFGRLGVPVFFVLSGYVIAMTGSRYDFTPNVAGRFLLRRMVRIAPPYWVAVLLHVAIFAAGKSVGRFQTYTIDFGQVLAHFLYVQEVLGYPEFSAAYWTLCLEVQFYVVFAASAVALRLVPKFGVAWFALLVVSSMLIEGFDMVPRQWFPRLWYQFGVGVLAFYASRERSALLVLVVLLLAMLGLGVYRGQPDGVAVALTAALLVVNRRLGTFPGVLLYLGQISYSLYLVHGLVALAIAKPFMSAPFTPRRRPGPRSLPARAHRSLLPPFSTNSCERRCIGWSRLVPVNSPQTA